MNEGWPAAKKVLVVEDDEDFALGVKIRLEANGYTVVAARDYLESVGKALKERPDLVLLDIGLPRVDGFAVLHRLRSLAPLADVPVIVLTGRDPTINRDRASKAGVSGFLQKPVENDELLSAIRSSLIQFAEEAGRS